MKMANWNAKVALFALIPDNDSSFNFLVSILYTQLFQQLFYAADHIHGGSLPVPVHFLMDEFANVSLPDDFDKILSVMRSRGVSVSIILQNLAQLKAADFLRVSHCGRLLLSADCLSRSCRSL